MKSYLGSLIFGLAGLQFILPLVVATASTSTKVRCYTSSGYSSCKHVPTHSHTATHHCTVDITKTLTPTTTKTPSATTVTVVHVSTSTVIVTASQNTLTATSTSTSTVTETSTTTETSTATTEPTTTTTTTPTVTATTSAAFTPIASAPGIIAAGGGAKRRLARSERRSEQRSKPANEPRAPAPVTTVVKPGLQVLQAKNGELQCPKKLYPERVDCVKDVNVTDTRTRTVTAKKTVTKTAPRRTSTATSISTVVSTSTAPNTDATTTVTSTATTTTTSTITTQTTTTSTSTTTSTEVAPASTTYPDCQTSNMITTINRQPIAVIIFDNGAVSLGTSDNAIDCCIQCHNTPDCAGFAFVSGQCYLPENTGTCDASMVSFGLETDPDPGTTPFTVGNGNCGQGEFRGSDQ